MGKWTLFIGLCLPVWAEVRFNRDVRPILADKCFSCHGADAKSKKVPFRLDIEAEAKLRAIVPGRPEASPLIQRVNAEEPARRMPPLHTGPSLKPDEIETLRTWIAEGAHWQAHWSFLPPVRPRAPAVRNKAWPRNPIDMFTLARMEKEGIEPSPEAGRETWLRRASLDLTGLPEAPAEVDTFMADRSPRAYERQVDRLLASPRYGERMAYRWLDAARYADTNGYQYDGERVMWRWRDWVIDAFNRNQPFDQFTLEQIAGDMLPNATLDQKIATGFNRNHRANTEEGIIFEEYAVEYVVDRIETTATVFLGLTLGCARCHNHKYDPFTQKEFYQLFAYFNNVPELGRAMQHGNSPPVIPAPTLRQQTQLAAIGDRIAAAEKLLAAVPGQPTGLSPWIPSRGLDHAVDFEDAKITRPGRFGAAGFFDGATQFDRGDVARYDIEDPFTISAWAFPEPGGAIVTRMVDRPKGKGFGVYVQNARVHVHITTGYEENAIRMDSEQTLQPGNWYHILFTYNGSRMAGGVKVFVNGRPAVMKVTQDTLYRPFRNAGSEFKEPLRVAGGGGPGNRFKGLIDEVRIYRRVLADDEIAALAGVAGDERHRRWAFLETAAPEQMKPYYLLLDEKEALERQFPTVMVMEERPVRKETHLLLRGQYDKRGEKVEPGVPAVLPPLPKRAPNNRLGFAKWLIDPVNPLLARVTVNRFWQMLFGVGIVGTVEDFGQQGDWPSHPELLDWLATEFIGSGWDTKSLLKKIVLSATYRQSSKATPERLQRDPENRWLARGPRFRLPAEVIRDQALFVAGLLVDKIGGPSVKPYQPAGLWKDMVMQDTEYRQSTGEDLYRRGLYTFWKRTVAPPMLTNFDAANREACVVRESRTNTPLQALNLMNDVTFVEAARFVGQRMIGEGGVEVDLRLRHGFLLVVGRRPTSGEVRVLREALQYHLDYFATDPERARTYLAQGETAADALLNPRELAAHASVASLMLNLDETVTKE